MNMLETLATVFGMSVDDVVKIMAGLGALVTTILAAVGRFLKNMNGAKKRSFHKIRRLEDIIEIVCKNETDFRIGELVIEMKTDQRDAADAKDADE
jgi:hypothetical protein